MDKDFRCNHTAYTMQFFLIPNKAPCQHIVINVVRRRGSCAAPRRYLITVVVPVHSVVVVVTAGNALKS